MSVFKSRAKELLAGKWKSAMVVALIMLVLVLIGRLNELTVDYSSLITNFKIDPSLLPMINRNTLNPEYTKFLNVFLFIIYILIPPLQLVSVGTGTGLLLVRKLVLSVFFIILGHLDFL